MGPRWKLLVEGLGKIERAEVEIRPLTLLVGENNSGKSYLASLLWGLIAMQMELAPPEGPLLQSCKDWVSERVAEGKSPLRYDLGTEELDLFGKLFESALDASKDALVERTFNSKSVGIKRLSFQNLARDRSVQLEWHMTARGKHTVTVYDATGITVFDDIMTSFSSENIEKARSVVLDLLMRRVTFGGHLTRLFEGFDSTFTPRDPVFLPASRTGFMQLYRASTRRILHGAFRREPVDVELTSPAFHFLDMLAFGLPEDRSTLYADEADLLERALKGRIDLVAERSSNEFRYLPDGAQAPLSMQLSSSLVTEIAPIILVLRHLPVVPLLILEEPEAHLHPRLQRKLAQVIVRLVRKGLYVLITTHSENFCQQINNFMKLGALDASRRADAQRKLGYDEQDYLELEDVSGYQFKFDNTGERSIVTEMKKTERGMVMPLFNEELIKLGEEVDFLDQQAAE